MFKTKTAPGIQMLETSEAGCRFVLSNVDLSVANALRRIMISEVPTIAIEQVEIIENSSVLNDEFIAHRLGLIPLKSACVGDFNFPLKCTCAEEAGCRSCTVEFTLDVKCDQEKMNVTSFDLVSNHDEVVVATEPDPPTERNDGILIVKLKRGQSINLKCYAKKGVGKDHSKFSPVCCSTFQYDPDITVHNAKQEEMTAEEKRIIVRSCPTEVYQYHEQQQRIVVRNPQECTYCNECTKTAAAMGRAGVVSIKSKDERFIFTVETTGSLRPLVIVQTALQVLREKIAVIATSAQTME